MFFFYDGQDGGRERGWGGGWRIRDKETPACLAETPLFAIEYGASLPIWAACAARPARPVPAQSCTSTKEGDDLKGWPRWRCEVIAIQWQREPLIRVAWAGLAWASDMACGVSDGGRRGQ